MKTTQYYGLKKPEQNDFVQVDDLNSNADKVDTAVHTVEQAAATAQRAAEDAMALAESNDRGITIVDDKIIAHCLDMENPHNTTAAQVPTAAGESVEAALATLSSNKANQGWVIAQLNQTMNKVGMFDGAGTLNDATQVNHWYEINLAQGVGGLPPGPSGSYNNSALYVFGQNSNVFTQVLFCGADHRIFNRKFVAWVVPQWSAWISLTTATPPQEMLLPLAGGLTDIGSDLRRNQEHEVSVSVDIAGSIGADAVVATLPVGYRPAADKKMDVVGTNVAGTVAGHCIISATTGQIINKCGAVTVLIGSRSFVASTDANASQSTPVRMAVPATRKTRSAAKREPETRLMCVVDATGRYVEFVEVTVTYDDQYETEGALFTPYCYALKDGEQLINSPKPPALRPHAGADGFVAPAWDFDAGAWHETATAAEIAAWALEHPAPSKAPEAIRARRNALLTATDKYAAADYPITDAERTEMYAYRQALRDVPEQAEFPASVSWPEVPNFVQKEGADHG